MIEADTARHSRVDCTAFNAMQKKHRVDWKFSALFVFQCPGLDGFQDDYAQVQAGGHDTLELALYSLSSSSGSS